LKHLNSYKLMYGEYKKSTYTPDDHIYNMISNLFKKMIKGSK